MVRIRLFSGSGHCKRSGGGLGVSMHVRRDGGLGRHTQIALRGRHATAATYPTVGHVDTSPGTGNGRRAIRVGKSEPGRRVFHARGYRRVPFAVITVPSPVLGRRAMQGGAAFGNATGTLRIWVAGLERVRSNPSETAVHKDGEACG